MDKALGNVVVEGYEEIKEIGNEINILDRKKSVYTYASICKEKNSLDVEKALER